MGVVVGVLAALAGVLGGVLHAVNAAAGRAFEPSFWLLSCLGAVAYGVTGAVLAAGRRVRVVRVVLLGIGAGQGLSLLLREYALLGPAPLDAAALWVASWLWAPAYLASAALLPLLLPDGALLSPRWRKALAVSTLALTLQALMWALMPYHLQDVPIRVRDLRNPVGLAFAANPATVAVVSALTAAAVIASLASVVVRWRTSTAERRQQLKWLLLGGAATVTLFMAGLLIPEPAGELVAALAVVPIPAACAVAAFRHRLWDVDTVVSVGLRYAVLSAVVVAVYAAVVSALGATSGAPVVATAVVALVLLPLQSRLQRWVNRLVHGEPEDPATALARLGDRLEATSDPADVADRLLPEVVARVSGLLQVPYVAIELADGGVVSHGEPVNECDRVLLRYGGAEVGHLVLSGRHRSPGEARRVDQLARQAAVAVHSVLLTREARRARQLVIAAHEEERRSLRRDLHDEVGPVIAALALQAETARDLVVDDPAAATRLLDRLVPRLNGAVADLRALVHDLRPPTLDELGLAGAVRELAVRFAGPERVVGTDLGELGELPAAVDRAAYRIVSEALSNAVRHASARTICVRVHREESRLRIEVTDDGTGISPGAPAGVGLASMVARAEELSGTCTIGAGPGGRGTTVTASVPLGVGEQR